MSIQRISLQFLARLTGSSSLIGCTTAACFNSPLPVRRSIRKPQRPLQRQTAMAYLMVLLCTSTALAAPPPTKEQLAAAGDAALQSNDNNLAIEKYSAITQPSDQTIYNLGIAHYRNGDLKQAANQFRMTIGSQDDSVAARSRFNLGNAFYAQALNQLTPPATDLTPPTATQPPTGTTPTPPHCLAGPECHTRRRGWGETTAISDNSIPQFAPHRSE